MNTLDATIVEILTDPTFKQVEDQSWWEVEVVYNCWGNETKSKIIAHTKEGIERYKVGSVIQV